MFNYSTFVILAVLSLIGTGCGKKEDLSIPSFAVKPLVGSSIQAPRAAPLKAFAGMAMEEVSCVSELEYANDSPQLIYGSRDSTHDANDSVTSFYFWAVFADCNVRQKAAEVSRGLQKDEDSNVSTVLNEGSDDHLEEFSHFISWTGDATSDNSTGRMVNTQVQKDGTKSWLRVDFSKSNGVKTVEFIDKSIFPAIGDNENETVRWSKAIFQERVNDKGEITGHYVAGRHWDDGTEEQRTGEEIEVLFAHLVKGQGAKIFKFSCTGQDSTAFNSDCDLNGSGASSGWNSDGSSDSSVLPLTNFTDISDELGDLRENFFTGTEEDLFRPVFIP